MASYEWVTPMPFVCFCCTYLVELTYAAPMNLLCVQCPSADKNYNMQNGYKTTPHMLISALESSLAHPPHRLKRIFIDRRPAHVSITSFFILDLHILTHGGLSRLLRILHRVHGR